MNSLPRGIRLAAIVVAAQGLVGPALAADSWWDSAINALMATRSGQTLRSDPVPARGAVDEWGSANAAGDKASERRQDERLRDDRVGSARPVRSGSSVSRTAAAPIATAAEPATRGGAASPRRVKAESAPGCVNVKRVWSGAAALASRGEEDRAYNAYLQLLGSCTADAELQGTAYEAQRNLSPDSMRRLLDEPIMAAPELHGVIVAIKVQQMFAANKARHEAEALGLARELRKDLLASDNAGALEVAGWLEQRAKSARVAETLFRAALRLDPNADGSREGLVYALVTQRKLALAEREAARMDGPNAEQVQADVLVAQAAQAQSEHDARKALELLKKAEELGGDPSPAAIETQAWALKQTGQPEKAASLFESLLQDDPLRDDLRQGLAGTLAQSKDLDALRQLSQDPNIGIAKAASSALAEKYVAAGQRDQAAALSGREAEGYGSSVGGTAGFRSKTGDSGEGRLKEQTMPALKGRLRVGDSTQLELEGERLVLDDGVNSVNGGEVRARVNTRVDDLSVMAGLGASRAGGVTKPTFEGKARMTTTDGYVEVGGTHEPVRDSVRSYAGTATDFTTSTTTNGTTTTQTTTAGVGRVMKTQVYLAGENLMDPVDRYKLFWALGAGSVSGRNSYNNGFYTLDAAVTKDFQHARFSWLNIGPYLHMGSYETDNNRFTDHYGGYFSPKSDLGMGVQAKAMTLEGGRSLFRLDAKAGYVTRGLYYGNDSGAQIEASLDAGWLLMPHLLLTSSVLMRNSPGYSDVGLRLGVTLPFETRRGLFSSDLDYQPAY
ncbi:tetratricopeptide repeat protein [Ideonella dechloratans]|uniref:tetratricopeptide repeat protein n=1 Tax=Ideonella dechloratans TaxID=36863 RepID=UPI0035AEFA29